MVAIRLTASAARVINIADEKPEIQGKGKHNKKRKHDFFEIHGRGTPFGFAWLL